MPVKGKVEISQDRVAFSEYMNFNNPFKSRVCSRDFTRDMVFTPSVELESSSILIEMIRGYNIII